MVAQCAGTGYSQINSARFPHCAITITRMLRVRLLQTLLSLLLLLYYCYIIVIIIIIIIIIMHENMANIA